jgi:hypothetical protein
MSAVHMAVRVENEFAAVFMSLPFGDHLHVHTALDCASDEHSTE